MTRYRVAGVFLPTLMSSAPCSCGHPDLWGPYAFQYSTRFIQVIVVNFSKGNIIAEDRDCIYNLFWWE